MPESGNSAPPTAGKYLRHAPGSETHIGEGEFIVKRIFVAAIAVSMLSGCMTTLQHREAVQDDSADRMTVGKVQREIKVGMSGAQVAQVLGSPNIVSTDEQRREVWIYDKIATDTAYSTSTGGISTLVLAWGGSAAGLAAPGFSQAGGASSKSQRTLTVIIKFDEGKAVRDFAYHTSRF
jgi:outer membrane protein assembly factor BamE (lipoprotein component of BamABCDE complex)